MTPSQRVFINTIAQYIRVFISMFLSLWTVRIVLSTLGSDDFGIYTLVAGVVSMLAFVTNALIQTTQRFISYYQGYNDLDKLKEVFCNSLFIHFFLGVFVAFFLELLTPFIFSGFLNVPMERIESASIVYQMVVVMLCITFISSPFKALLVSHENIVYISIIEVIDVILKLFFAFLLNSSPIDKLVFYSITMLLVQVFNFAMQAAYSYKKYDECVYPKIGYFKWSYVQSIISFAGWNVYSTACIVGRQQGVAVVVNRILGTVANAAYGIGFQIAAYTSFLSSSLVNAVRPQIMTSEGAGNRERALWLSNVISKFSFFLLSAVCIPCMFEIDTILKIWLGNVPDGANVFCNMVLMTVVVDAITGGLGHINQAVGNIKWYAILMNSPKLLTIPALYIILKLGGSLTIAAFGYVIIEMLCTWIRLPFVSKTTGLNIRLFINEVIFKEIIPLWVLVTTCVICVYFTIPFRFLITFSVSIALYFFSIWLFGLTNKEKQILCNIMVAILQKIKR